MLGVKVLLGYGAQISRRDGNGDSPFDLALRARETERERLAHRGGEGEEGGGNTSGALDALDAVVAVLEQALLLHRAGGGGGGTITGKVGGEGEEAGRRGERKEAAGAGNLLQAARCLHAALALPLSPEPDTHCLTLSARGTLPSLCHLINFLFFGLERTAFLLLRVPNPRSSCMRMPCSRRCVCACMFEYECVCLCVRESETASKRVCLCVCVVCVCQRQRDRETERVCVLRVSTLAYTW